MQKKKNVPIVNCEQTQSKNTYTRFLRGNYRNARMVQLAIEMAHFGASSGVICGILGVQAKRKVRLLVNEVHANPSERDSPESTPCKQGRDGYSTAWYVRVPERMVHTALLIKILNDTENEVGPEKNNIEKAERLLKVYKTYLCLIGGDHFTATIPFSRFWLATKLFAAQEIVFRRCKTKDCYSEYLDASSTSREVCQVCYEENEAKKTKPGKIKLVTASGD